MADNSEFLFLDEVARRSRVPISTVRYWIAEAHPDLGKLKIGFPRAPV